MIVNACRSVDKTNFLHKLKGLRGFQTPEQGLLLKRTLTEQKNGSGQVARFRTFDPVDMHGLVHSGGKLTGFPAVFGAVLQASPWLVAAGRVGTWFLAGMKSLPKSKFFFAWAGKQQNRPGAVVDVAKRSGRQPIRSRHFFFGEAAKTKRVARFTTKSLYTE